MRLGTWLIALSLATASAGCASQPAQGSPAEESLVPGTIGIAVERKADTLVVAAVRRRSAAAASVRIGDVVRSYNGVPVASERDFNRLVLESEPGTVAHLGLARGGVRRSVDIPVSEIDSSLVL